MHDRDLFGDSSDDGLPLSSSEVLVWLDRFLRRTFSASGCGVGLIGAQDGAVHLLFPQPRSSEEEQAWVARLGAGERAPHWLYGAIPLDRHRSLGVVLVRAPAEGAFSAEERGLLDKMLPLIARMLHMRELLDGGEERWAAAVTLFDRLSIGMILVGPGGALLSMNRSAEEIVDEVGLAVDPDEATAGRQLVRRLTERSAPGGGKGPAPAVAAGTLLSLPRDSGSPVTVLVTPLAPVHGATGGGAGGGAGDRSVTALFLCDPDRSLADQEESLRALYGLTRLEAQIVVHLVDGLSIEDCAKRLRISVHTIRAYLKQIFSKTGAHRQSSLIRLIIASLGGIRAAPGERANGNGNGQAVGQRGSFPLLTLHGPRDRAYGSWRPILSS